MKRILCLILSLVMMCTLLCGCNSNNANTKETTKTAEKVESTAKTEYGDAGLYQDGVRVMTWEEVLEDVGYDNFDKETIKNICEEEDGELYYSSYFEELQGKLVLPEGVKTIKRNAFSSCKELTEIILPQTLVEIGDYAFEATHGLKSITIPNSVTSIGEGAFSMSSVESIELSENITEISAYTFADNPNLLEIELPKGIKTIGVCAFSSCLNLKKINIPEGVSKIEEGVFYHCESLTEISIPASVKTIETPLFYECASIKEIKVDEKNKNYVSIDGVLFNKDKTELLYFPGNKDVTSYTVPNGVKTIACGAFESSIGLTDKTYTLTIPASVENIVFDFGDEDEVNLTARFWCRVSNINVDKNNKNYSSVDGVLYDKNVTEVIYYPSGKNNTEYTVPESVTKIDDLVFGFYIDHNANKYLKTIRGKKGSVAETFAKDAKENELKFIPIQ